MPASWCEQMYHRNTRLARGYTNMGQGQMRAHCVLFVTPKNLQILQNETFDSEILFSLCLCPHCVLRIKIYLRETHHSSVCSQTGTISDLGCMAAFGSRILSTHQWGNRFRGSILPDCCYARSKDESPVSGFLRAIVGSNRSDCPGNDWLCHGAAGCHVSLTSRPHPQIQGLKTGWMLRDLKKWNEKNESKLEHLFSDFSLKPHGPWASKISLPSF